MNSLPFGPWLNAHRRSRLLYEVDLKEQGTEKEELNGMMMLTYYVEEKNEPPEHPSMPNNSESDGLSPLMNVQVVAPFNPISESSLQGPIIVEVINEEMDIEQEQGNLIRKPRGYKKIHNPRDILSNIANVGSQIGKRKPEIKKEAMEGKNQKNSNTIETVESGDVQALREQ